MKKTSNGNEQQDKKPRKLSDYIQLLSEAQEMAHMGSWEWNVVTNEVEWSDMMFILLGLKPSSTMPSYQLALHHVHPDDKERYEKAIQETLANKTTFYLENKIVKEDNSVISVISRAKCFLDEDENLIRMVGTVQEISLQKRLEKAHIKHQRLIAFGEMASSIAHDFNNSLQSMIGNLEIVKIQKGLSDSSLDKLNNIMNVITDVSERVNALQSFSDTVNENVESELIDLNSILKESLNESQPFWKDNIEKIGLKINITTVFADSPKINCNKGELKSVIFNLIKNSIEAMPEGGNIIIETCIKAKSVFITFTDTGIGMDEESKLKIFQPFYTTKGFKEGRGLGMSGVYGLINKHGGNIGVKFSELGKGTIIEIVYPISKQNEIEEISKNRKMVNKHYNVLWVDDDLSIRENASELIELMGHKCGIANGGKNALKYLNHNKCDIVFTDIGMPEMNGWELSKNIRNTCGDKIKIVVVTGWDIDENTKNDHDVNFVLQKPFTMEQIKEIIMNV
ncbi:response regulator [Polaribacter litorisediminis]|uniref:hybrid sensor histidine kinase/response regulator n=1 Tax=Polaribacter litorisediminis TaxID=1908341 RepID=UPI001CC11E35|nr:response regulator [Polaribacter litorisediminis]UAM99823.1 response regulator [Polaribacter litorisediminis]